LALTVVRQARAAPVIGEGLRQRDERALPELIEVTAADAKTSCDLRHRLTVE
jgi:hypothetical protein